MEEKKPLWWMIAFGIVRAAIAFLGGWLQGHGLIDADTNQRLLSEGVTQALSWIILAIPVIWSCLQKTQVWGWVKTALKLDDSRTTAADIPKIAPGPDRPL